ncbi:MAG: TetR/AcrR family transcriptional regulator [Spirochaetes bacterium]|nr:TetR/AcrR family transcriptional regulator [Spirochaetota bacterium]
MIDKKLKLKIRKTALELFKTISYSKTSVSNIAKAAGIGKGTVYLYYKSKEDIISAIIQERFEEIRAQDTKYFFDEDISFNEKLIKFNNRLIDETIKTKELLFGSFENLKGETVRDVFDTINQYNGICITLIEDLIKFHDLKIPKSIEQLHIDIDEYLHLILGRMIVHFLKIDWDDVTPLKQAINSVSFKMFEAVVLK